MTSTAAHPRALGAAALTLAAALLGPAAPAAAAEVCTTDDLGRTVCVTSVVPENTVDAIEGGPFSVVVTLSASSPDYGCLALSYLPLDTVELTPVPGRPKTYRGSGDVLPLTNRPGEVRTEFVGVGGCGDPARFWVRREDLAGTGVEQPVLLTGIDDTEPPVLRSFSAGPPLDVDVTAAPVSVPVEVRATDVVGLRFVQVSGGYVRGPAADPRSPTDLPPAGEALRLVSGTIRDGVWRGSVTVPAGALGELRFRVRMQDRYNQDVDVTSEELAAAGYPAAVRARTTAPPRAPLSPRGDTRYVLVPGVGLVIGATVSWTAPSGPPATVAVVDSSSPGCGTSGGPAPASPLTFTGRNPFSLCTVTFRLVNGFGQGPPVTVRFL